MATVDVHGRYVIPCRGLSALFVLTVWAMREPRYRGMGSSKIPTLFVLWRELNLENIIIGSLMMKKTSKSNIWGTFCII